MRQSFPQRHRRRAGGFTLIELLVVVGILVLLASILIPTIAHIRTSVHQANTSSRIVALTNAIENYFHTFNAYPGPAADSEILTVPQSIAQKIPNSSTSGIQVTGTENLTLALLGGLRLSSSTGGVLDTATFVPEECGKGSLSLNPKKASQRYGPFVEPKLGGLDISSSAGSWKTWSDTTHPGGSPVNAKDFGDTVIPEFVDAYPDALPILYIRATLGASGSIEGARDASGNSVTKGNAAYDPGQLQYYVFPALLPSATQSPTAPWIVGNAFSNTSSVDPQVLADFNQATATPPTSPANYFGQYLAPSVPRSKGYLLITAGPDRKYMTKDDTINNGSAVK